MRLISMSCDPNFIFQIDGHQSLTIIEVDGINHEALVVDQIQIFAGKTKMFTLVIPMLMRPSYRTTLLFHCRFSPKSIHVVL